jgi:EAL domain-containing protein (putative c-di-GMP-specific phosphodiesterase class I)/CheY-like chemotaxis protein
MGAPQSALVVDDDPFICSVLSGQLSGLGFTRVDTAENGFQARDILRTHGAYDLIVSDLQMPGMDGIELLREIESMRMDAGVILMSTFEDPVLHTAEELGRLRHLRLLGSVRKPVDRAQLQALVQHLSDQPRTVVDSVGDIHVEDLRRAILANSIEVYVQPKVDIITGRPQGVEALARWTLDGYGAVPPTLFIPLAEQHDLINPLTDVVLVKALRACAEWRKAGIETTVAVNLSSKSLNRLDLPNEIQKLVQSSGVEANQLVLEITESALFQDLAKALDILVRLRLMGYRLSIDDFGTGYSSLQQLGRVPFTELKIDRSFVVDAPHNEEARSILRTSIRLARTLHLRTVAEGVETQEQLALLRDEGCDLGQGYLFSKPMPAADLPAWWNKPPVAGG